jgi:hypothetical protein
MSQWLWKIYTNFFLEKASVVCGLQRCDTWCCCRWLPNFWGTCSLHVQVGIELSPQVNSWPCLMWRYGGKPRKTSGLISHTDCGLHPEEWGDIIFRNVGNHLQVSTAVKLEDYKHHGPQNVSSSNTGASLGRTWEQTNSSPYRPLPLLRQGKHYKRTFSFV